MKHIKSYENNEVEKTYFTYVDIEKLDYFLTIIKEYNIKYTLYLLKNNQIGLFLILKMTENLKNKIRYILNITYISDEPDTISKIIEKCEDVTNLSVSEIEEIFNIFNQEKKYNL